MVVTDIVPLNAASHPARRRWAYAFAVAIPAIYATVLFSCWQRVGPRDHDQFLVFHELQYWNASLFGLAKQWSPVMCSGLSLAGEPQVPFASLSMLLGYVFGPLHGIALATVIYFAIGWAGAYLYGGLWFGARLQRALAASLFIGNGFFIGRFAYGHVDFIPFLSLPLALWMIHQLGPPNTSGAGRRQVAIPILLLGALFAVVIDGSPVAIVHWMFWVALYSAAFSWVSRSFRPLLCCAAACLIASVLDAGYLWPMINAQTDFPRLTQDTFTGPWALLWFLTIPMRGKLLPANGKGIELSVFIGPVLLYFIWRYRRALLAELPKSIKIPLLVVSVISIWMGMGSLHALGAPQWLSPFDWLRPLPGFRSIGVTGRYWGFLALPLSLLAAGALWRFLHQEPRNRKWNVLLTLALLLQVGFQGESLYAMWWPSRVYADVPLENIFHGRFEAIRSIAIQESAAHYQGNFITPTRAVLNCYDMDDFIRADVQPGTNIIKDIRADDSLHLNSAALHGGYVDWNHIRIADGTPMAATPVPGDPIPGVRIVLNQAYHPYWHAAHCAVERGSNNNLVLNCSAAQLRRAPVTAWFFDPWSDLGMHVSVVSWTLAGAVLLLIFVVRWSKAYHKRSLSVINYVRQRILFEGGQSGAPPQRTDR